MLTRSFTSCLLPKTVCPILGVLGTTFSGRNENSLWVWTNVKWHISTTILSHRIVSLHPKILCDKKKLKLFVADSISPSQPYHFCKASETRAQGPDRKKTPGEESWGLWPLGTEVGAWRNPPEFWIQPLHSHLCPKGGEASRKSGWS